MLSLNPGSWYEGILFSVGSQRLMRQGKILPDSATPASLVSALLMQLAQTERLLGEQATDTDSTMSRLYDYLKRGVCILGTPLLTNVVAGHRTFSSCTAAQISIAEIDSSTLDHAEAYYRLNMGSGYNLNAAADPTRALLLLNQHAAKLESSGLCERYIGNIAHVSVDHPRAKDFIEAKIQHQGIVHFNTSIDLTDDFMNAVLGETTPSAASGDPMISAELWEAMVRCAWTCGDPGIISLARYNSGNPLPNVSPYVTVAPCAEVGLAAGESCVFAYINLAACLRPGSLELDFELIGSAAECLTRVLDDVLEASVSGYPHDFSKAVMMSNRKVSIGICGYADMLMWKGLDYGSPKGIECLKAALATINFRSKFASLSLASRRGSFPQFRFSRLVTEPGFVSRFGAFSGATVPLTDWNELERAISAHGLRNAMTTALPPSGRSSRLIGVNPSLEPSLATKYNGEYPFPIKAQLEQGLVRETSSGALIVTMHGVGQSWPEQVQNERSLFRCATEIDFSDHLATLEVAARLVDDGVSKTINLPESAPMATVDAIFKAAWSSGLKAISVYRNNSKTAHA